MKPHFVRKSDGISPIISGNIATTGRRFFSLKHVLVGIALTIMRRAFVRQNKDFTWQEKIKPAHQAPVLSASVNYRSGILRRFLLRFRLRVFQHPTHRNNQHNQYCCTNQQCNGAAGEEIRQHVQLVSLNVPTNQTRRQVT